MGVSILWMHDLSTHTDHAPSALGALGRSLQAHVTKAGKPAVTSAVLAASGNASRSLSSLLVAIDVGHPNSAVIRRVA